MRKIIVVGLLLVSVQSVSVARVTVSSDAWFAAVGRGDILRTRELLAAGMAVDAPTRVLGRTALIQASASGRLELCRVLLDAGASVDAIEARTGRTALHYAARAGHADLVAFLLQRGADPRRRDLLSGLDVIEFARLGARDTLAQRLEAADVLTPVTPPILPNAIASPPRHGHASPMPASAPEIIEDSDVEVPRIDALLVAQSASEAGFDDEIEPLSSVSPWLTAPEGGEQLLLNARVFDAVRSRNIEAVDSALAAGGKIDARDWDGFTPLNLAVHRNDTAMVLALIERGAVAETRDRFGWTPLLHAAWKGFAGMVRILVNHGAQVEARSQDSTTALHLAAERDHLDAVEVLIERGSRVNVRTRDNRYRGWTPLMIAAARGNDLTVSRLLTAGARPSLRGENGWTALKAAYMNYRDKTVEILKIHGAQM